LVHPDNTGQVWRCHCDTPRCLLVIDAIRQVVDAGLQIAVEIAGAVSPR
jgi:hypothetical protein